MGSAITDLYARVWFAVHRAQEREWIMGGSTALCRHCRRIMDVVPINAQGDWMSGTVFCGKAALRGDRPKPAELIAIMDRIASVSGKLTRV
jgi:hypothetical protein